MSLVEILSIVSCITSTLTMIVVLVAVLPQVKQGMAIVRDAVLWAALVLLMAVLIWYGLSQLADSEFVETISSSDAWSADESSLTRSASRSDWQP